jgi:GNAT superfamily N-acetyltransferase
MAPSYAPLVRRATRADSETILSLVDALADYEKLTPQDADAKARFVNDLFGAKPRLDAFLVEIDGQVAGYALVLELYSSFRALPILYLEDLFVRPESRGMKAGYALFTAMVEEAKRRGCFSLDWAVLDWNRLALDFYQKLGAQHKKEWQLYRLELADHADTEPAKAAGQQGD